MKYHYYKKDGTPIKRFNANLPVDYFIKYQKLADEMDTTMSDLLMKFIDSFEKFKDNNK
jgi:hypothetical protein